MKVVIQHRRLSACGLASSVAQKRIQWASVPRIRGLRAVQTRAEPEGGSTASEMNKMGQNFNSAGISLFLQILGGDKSLALPHLSVTDIRSVNWSALRDAGMCGVVFDKDNTLTVPFASKIEDNLLGSLEQCKKAFDGKVVLYSNSAGLAQYDPEGKEADAIEAELGIYVLRHVEKKPAGGKSELEAYFGCTADKLLMVGDRYLTDVVFGNRHGMFTIRPAPFTTEGEPLGVVYARKIEDFYVNRWIRKGIKPPPHAALEGVNADQFVNSPSLTQSNAPGGR